MAITASEFSKIAQIVDEKVAPLQADLLVVKEQVGGLTTSVDELLTVSKRHEQEWLIVRSQHQKMRSVLINKDVATEGELSIS